MTLLSSEELSARIKSLAGASAADLIGIAPGDAFSADELGDLGSAFGPVRSVVVLAQHIVDPVQVLRFQSAENEDDALVATCFCDAILRDACWRVVGLLREAGYRATIPRNLRYGVSEPRHDLSYKKAGVFAGLGTFGKSQLLIHPDCGPWMRLRAVVTDALLPPDTPIEFSPCTDCGACVAACPSGALSESGFDRAACEDFYNKVGRGARLITPYGQINCDECMRACPVGVAPPRLESGAQRA